MPVFFKHAYHPRTLEQIVYLRSALRWRTSTSDAMLAALALGIGLVMAGQAQVPAADLNKLMSLDRKWEAVAFFYRALANEAQGQNQSAESDFKRAIALESTLAMERRWVDYLKSIQADGDYANWSGKPYDLYLRIGGM